MRRWITAVCAIVVASASMAGPAPSGPTVLGGNLGPVQRISLSPDGRTVAAEIAGPESTQGIYLVERKALGPQAGKAAQLTKLVAHGSDFRWGPDGRRFVFDREEDSAACDPDGQVLWTGDRSAQQRTRLTCGSMGCWSPDGAKIVFVRKGSLYEIALGTRKTSLLLASVGRHSAAFDPVFSPDGKSVYFGREDGRLWTLATSSGKSRPVTRAVSGAADGQPAVSPDGRLVAFSRGYYGSVRSVEGSRLALSHEILVIDTDTGKAQSVTTRSSGLSDESPQWLPDGRTMLFVRTFLDTGDTRIMSIAVPDGRGFGIPDPSPRICDP